MTENESMREEREMDKAPAPQRVARRRTTKKAEVDTVDASENNKEVSSDVETLPNTVSDKNDAAQEKPVKRRTRSRKPVAESEVKEDSVNSTQVEVVADAAVSSERNDTPAEVTADVTTEKPKRRTVRTKRTVRAGGKREQTASNQTSDAATDAQQSADVDAALVEVSEDISGQNTEMQSTAECIQEETAEVHEEAQAGQVSVDVSDENHSASKDATSSRQNNEDAQTDRKRQKNGKKDQRPDKHDKRNKRDRSNRNKEIVPSLSLEDLTELKVADLRAKAAELDLDVTGLKKAELIQAVYDATLKAEGFIQVTGILDIMPDGYGFLRTQGYLPSETDCYVGLSLIRRNGLRKGDMIVGQTRPARENEKYAAIQKVITVNDKPLEELGQRVRFADLTPVYPDERLLMEHGKNTITARVIDLAAPIGKGQRGLIVSPPKAGKTTILKDIAAAISVNNPEVHLMCLLVDERPEEVTDMQRSIKGEVISSTFDMPSENHIAVAELVIERAKRMVENGRDVVILLDSLTRLARAYNLAQPASGRILSGGVDSTALYPPKRFLGAARNIEHGGSLTILASALIDTGSKMDEVIFEEFKGTGNMELKLDRYLADRRIFPAIDPVQSGTRKEDLLLDPQEAPLIWAVRRILANLNNAERAMDMLIKSLKQTDNNQEFLIRTAKKAQHNTKGEGITEF